jgi:hypothetical protein
MPDATPGDILDLVPLTDGELELELSEMEAISVKSLLAANGIDALIDGASQMPNLPYKIQVPAAQLADATRIYREATEAGAAAAEATELAGEASGESQPDNQA